jgi:lipoprotein-anchoring transpeptidase ErfK/SrfK
MGSARIAVFFVALMMMGAHVAQAQEGTGNPRAFVDSAKDSANAAATRAGQAAPAAPAPIWPSSSASVIFKPSDVAVSQTGSGSRVIRPSQDTALRVVSGPAVGTPRVIVAQTAEPKQADVKIQADARAPAPGTPRVVMMPAEPIAATPAATLAPATPRIISMPAETAAKPAVQAAEPPVASIAAAPVEPTVVTPPKPVMTLVANVDLTAQRLVVSANGVKLHSWAISSGTREFPTPVGNFKAEWQAKMWFSKKYDDAPMPHAVFFKDGAAIHATQATGSLGRAASHGCVRLAPANAETFYKLVQKHGLSHTRISVHGTPKFAPPAVARAPSMPIPYGQQRYAGQVAFPYTYGVSSFPAQAAPRTWPGDPAPAAVVTRNAGRTYGSYQGAR